MVFHYSRCARSALRAYLLVFTLATGLCWLTPVSSAGVSVIDSVLEMSSNHTDSWITVSLETLIDEAGNRSRVMWVANHDGDTLLWAQSLLLEGSLSIDSMITTSEGNLFVTGRISGRILNREISIASPGFERVFIIAFDPDGRILGDHLFSGLITIRDVDLTAEVDEGTTHLTIRGEARNGRFDVYRIRLGTRAEPDRVTWQRYRLGLNSSTLGLPMLYGELSVSRSVIRPGALTDLTRMFSEEGVARPASQDHIDETGGGDPIPPNPDPPPPPDPPDPPEGGGN